MITLIHKQITELEIVAINTSFLIRPCGVFRYPFLIILINSFRLNSIFGNKNTTPSIIYVKIQIKYRIIINQFKLKI